MDELTEFLANQQLQELTAAIERGERWFTVKRIENMFALKVVLTEALEK